MLLSLFFREKALKITAHLGAAILNIPAFTQLII